MRKLREKKLALLSHERGANITHILLITQVSLLLNLKDIKGYLGILRDIWGRYLRLVVFGQSNQLLIVNY